jgi:hypothetical protein
MAEANYPIHSTAQLDMSHPCSIDAGIYDIPSRSPIRLLVPHAN